MDCSMEPLKGVLKGTACKWSCRRTLLPSTGILAVDRPGLLFERNRSRFYKAPVYTRTTPYVAYPPPHIWDSSSFDRI